MQLIFCHFHLLPLLWTTGLHGTNWTTQMIFWQFDSAASLICWLYFNPPPLNNPIDLPMLWICHLYFNSQPLHHTITAFDMPCHPILHSMPVTRLLPHGLNSHQHESLNMQPPALPKTPIATSHPARCFAFALLGIEACLCFWHALPTNIWSTHVFQLIHLVESIPIWFWFPTLSLQ